ncbi:MAG: glutamate racemase [Lentisphaeraceae bacterium]|nr:glutamate racemase [Lentisphaeraceae bacterium]
MSLKPESFSQIKVFPSKSILLVDSGVGSLEINYQISKLIKNVPIISIGDHLNFPYGNKSEDFIREKVIGLIDVGVKYFNPQVIVVACNSASTFILPELREKLTIPIVGVVPPVKPAAQYSESKVIAVLSTEKTAETSYLDELISKYADGVETIIIPCENLATFAEQKAAGITVSDTSLYKELLPLAKSPLYNKVDSLVLGCTHFSLLKNELIEVLRPDIQIYDPAEAIAKQVLRVFPREITGLNTENWFISTGSEQIENKNLLESLGINRLVYI